MSRIKKTLDYLTGHRTHIMMSLFMIAILVRSLMLTNELFAGAIYDLLWGVLFYGAGAGMSKTGSGAKEALRALKRNQSSEDYYGNGGYYGNYYGGSRFDPVQDFRTQAQEE